MSIGFTIKKLRHENDMTQEQLADLLGLTAAQKHPSGHRHRPGGNQCNLHLLHHSDPLCFVGSGDSSFSGFSGIPPSIFVIVCLRYSALDAASSSSSLSICLSFSLANSKPALSA